MDDLPSNLDHPYKLLTVEGKAARGRWAAKAMRELSQEERDRLIAENPDKVIDAREIFRRRAFSA